jgi:hypothetical protein
MPAFVINHSLSYSCAALFSWTEYWLGVLLLGRRKFCFPFCSAAGAAAAGTEAAGGWESWSLMVSMAGVALAVLGQVSYGYDVCICIAFGTGIVIMTLSCQTIRFVGMRTCGQSFNHIIATQRSDEHVLITHGIYRCECDSLCVYINVCHTVHQYDR